MNSRLNPLHNAVYADWPAPDNIVAFTTGRLGGHSEKPYEQFNLAQHVGDQPQLVEKNRQLLMRHSEDLNHLQWLNQVHGTDVVCAGDQGELTADACYSSTAGLGCSVLTADCLPILICDNKGKEVAAVHAGWRGLVAGIIEKTLLTFKAENKHLLVWLGPAISQSAFEVGSEVREAFLQASESSQVANTEKAFLPNKDKPGHYFANLYQLAQIRLEAIGIFQVYGGELCSFKQSDQFYSFRRDTVTGRMASVIYRQAN